MIEINYYILIVQMVTFLAAVFILWKFMWGPFTAFLETRKASIESDIASAESGKAEALKLEAEYKELLRALKSDRQSSIDKAKMDGEVERKGIITKAHDEARRMLENAEAKLKEEEKKAGLELRRETASLSVLLAEKILKQSIDKDVQARLLKEFSQEIERTNG